MSTVEELHNLVADLDAKTKKKIESATSWALTDKRGAKNCCDDLERLLSNPEEIRRWSVNAIAGVLMFADLGMAVVTVAAARKSLEDMTLER
jgi:hypothetical protein